MLTTKDLSQIKSVVEKVVEQKLEEKLEQKLEEKLEQKLEDKLNKRLKPIEKTLKKIQRDLIVSFDFTDKTLINHKFRIEKIESVLNIPRDF